MHMAKYASAGQLLIILVFKVTGNTRMERWLEGGVRSPSVHLYLP